MKSFKKLYAPLLGIIVCIFVFLKANTGRFFGVLINRFFPCVQNPMNSFPCFGIYDIGMMIAALILGIILIGVIIFRLVKLYKDS
jgi:hypothetical protein